MPPVEWCDRFFVCEAVVLHTKCNGKFALCGDVIGNPPPTIRKENRPFWRFAFWKVQSDGVVGRVVVPADVA